MTPRQVSRALGPRDRGARVAFLLLSAILPLLPSRNLFSASPGAPPAAGLAGLWHAALVPTPEYPVLFDVRIVPKGKGLAAFLVNGAIEVPFTSAAWDGKTLTLELAHDDAKLVAERRGDALEGRYLRTVVSGVADVPFTASRTAPPSPAAPAHGESVAGSWGFELATGPASVDRLTGLFTQNGAAVAGTLLSVTGDYGALHGWFDGERLVLTVFDGVHACRFDGEVLGDGTLAGEYRSRTNPPVSWRARRLDAAAAGTFLPPATGTTSRGISPK